MEARQYTYTDNCLYTWHMEQTSFEHSQSSPNADTARDRRLRELVAAIADQDEKAFADFYDQMAGQIYAIALKICTDAAVAEEVTSDTFMQIWQQATRYSQDRGKVSTWALTIARSRALDAIRRNAKHQHIDDSYSDSSHNEITDGKEPVGLLEALEQKTVIYAALTKLAQEQQQLLSLAFFKGMSHSEIAEHTGLPLGTAKSKIRAAIQQIKCYLEHVELR